MEIDPKLARDLWQILDAFSYHPSPESTVEFSARLNDDWFYSVKNKLEKTLKKENEHI